MLPTHERSTETHLPPRAPRQVEMEAQRPPCHRPYQHIVTPPNFLFERGDLSVNTDFRREPWVRGHSCCCCCCVLVSVRLMLPRCLCALHGFEVWGIGADWGLGIEGLRDWG